MPNIKIRVVAKLHLFRFTKPFPAVMMMTKKDLLWDPVPTDMVSQTSLDQKSQPGLKQDQFKSNKMQDKGFQNKGFQKMKGDEKP